MDNSFTAAGLVEGNLVIARNFLANELSSSLWSNIKGAYAKCQCHFFCRCNLLKDARIQRCIAFNGTFLKGFAFKEKFVSLAESGGNEVEFANQYEALNRTGGFGCLLLYRLP
ncbi:hypothetical protein KJ966_22420 [bacterium]|nr:hypothetical protein [bacterium]